MFPPAIDESMSASETSWRAITKPTEGLTMGTLKIQYEETTLPELAGAKQHVALMQSKLSAARP
jgi:hypothetical protein